MNSTTKNILYIIGFAAIPILIGLPFMLNSKRQEIIEVLLIVSGLIEIIAMLFRNGSRERKNRRTYGRYKSQPGDKGYDEYKSIQTMLLSSSITNFTLALLWFLFFTEWFPLW